MITFGGFIAGTLLFANMGATPLQPMTVQQTDNNTLKVRTAKNMDIHISNAKHVNIIVDSGHEPIASSMGKNTLDIKNVKAGTVLNIDMQVGYNNESMNINGHKIYINSDLKTY